MVWTMAVAVPSPDDLLLIFGDDASLASTRIASIWAAETDCAFVDGVARLHERAAAGRCLLYLRMGSLQLLSSPRAKQRYRVVLSLEYTFTLPVRSWMTPMFHIDFDSGTGFFRCQMTVHNITLATVSFLGFVIVQDPSSPAFNLLLLRFVLEDCAETVALGGTGTVSALVPCLREEQRSVLRQRRSRPYAGESPPRTLTMPTYTNT